MTPDGLADYRAKRYEDRTPEPFGKSAVPGAGRFVIQKHAARRTHYDLRLEMEGVLRSWAVPKGPSTDPAEKRLAVHVEDHPLDYADFEGVIPEGEYGAGPVIVWDQGRWVPLEDPRAGFQEGKLLFQLRGHKLRGVWALIRLEKGETGKEWLLIRERKGPEPPLSDEEIPDTSVLSGLTVEERAAADAGEMDPGREIRERLAAPEGSDEGARRRRVDPRAVKLMLARSRETPFSDPDWLFELKLDGYRMLGARTAEGPLLLTRNGKDATATFPELALALRSLPHEHVVLDGEVVVQDPGGIPRFQLLQKRAQLRRSVDIHRAAVRLPATFYAFDLLGFEDFDLRPLPLEERKALLRRLLPPLGPIRYSEHFAGAGEELYAQVEGMGLEGIVAKAADSRYRGGRSGKWIKVRADRTDDFAVVGFTEPGGSRTGFGALHLAVWEPGPAAGEPLVEAEEDVVGTGEDAPAGGETSGAPEAAAGRLVYAGKVGTGFSEAQLGKLRERLESRRREAPPCRTPEGDPPPEGPDDAWVEPEMVVEVRYREWTEDGVLRQPAFLRVREDKRPEECVRGHGGPGAAEAELPEPGAVTSRPAPPETPSLTNLEKTFWPEDGLTKGDLLDYYRRIAPFLLPYLADRPLVLTRYPDGIDGKSFFQKDAPAYVPDWVRTEGIRSEGADREIDYFIAEDEASLLYLANLGTIPIHVWASRTASLERPDWCVLDLDPKEAPFEDVVAVARHLHELCEEIGLPSHVKTSGSTGLHVLVPLGGSLGWDEGKTLGELLARTAVSDLPDIATVVRNPAKREGKVYVDYVQNGRGKTIVAPYSVRARPGAPVSAPLRWREVTPGLEIGRFDIRTMPRRARAMKDDPLRPVLDERPDLLGALERLRERLSSG